MLKRCMTVSALLINVLVSHSVAAEPLQKKVNILDTSQPMEQINSVSELRDVNPSDWAYEALRSLVERYGCIVGYPDGSYRGRQAMTRSEFAAGLNACLNTIERLIQSGKTLTPEELAKLKRLTQEFGSELAVLGKRLDSLETRTSFLENHQFSTTTKLNGDVIFIASGLWGGQQAGQPKGTPLDKQIISSYRYRANLDTSFNGKDNLRIRLQTGNFHFGRGGTNLTDFNFTAPGNNDLEVNKLQYTFPVTDNLTAWISAVKITLDDISDPLSPYNSSFTDGAISYFGSLSPAYLIADNTGTGAGLLYKFNPEFNLGLYYSAENGSSPRPGQGLFNGQYSAGAQLTYSSSANTGIGLVYLHQYKPDSTENFGSILGFTGTANSDNPFNGNATSSDNVALVGTLKVAPWLNLEGWTMYTRAYAEGSVRQGDTADIWNWKLSIDFRDLFKEGNLGVITFGQPPHASSITNRNNIADTTSSTYDTPWLVEAFYVFKVSDNISLTPGVWVVVNPENNSDPIWVGNVRLSFKF